jgi:hypothetical protein
MSRTVVRTADLSPPHKIDDADFEAICRTFEIVEGQRRKAREFLDEIVTVFADAIAKQRALPGRKDDRLAIQRAAREIRRAGDWLNRAKGPAARAGLRATGGRIGPLVSASWLRWRFPDDPDTPAVHYWPQGDVSGRSPAKVPANAVDVDDLSLDQRIFFARRRGRELILAILAETAEALDVARRRIVEAPDGRKPLEFRTYLMAALAELWRHLGNRPTSSMRSKFGAFCESVFEAIGWPTEGVNAALPDAIATSRELYGS